MRRAIVGQHGSICGSTCFVCATQIQVSCVDKKNKGIGSRETRDCVPGSSLILSLAIFIYGDCGSPYSSYKSY
jgi:hypothetical protein